MVWEVEIRMGREHCIDHIRLIYYTLYILSFIIVDYFIFPLILILFLLPPPHDKFDNIVHPKNESIMGNNDQYSCTKPALDMSLNTGITP